jgi:RNA polymerase sigma-70 factor (ECF subfamily)
MTTTPVSLLQRLQQPDPAEAWGEFVTLYTPMLYFWARRLGLRQEDAADLIQDVFAILVVKLPAFSHDQGKSFRGWLRTVVTNKWRDHQRRARLPLGESPQKQLNILESSDGLEQLWDQEEQQYLVRHALEIMQRHFEPATWKACWGMVVEGKSAAELASTLGISENAVYIAKSRVLARLRIELEGLLD